jgi:hypothetical protein
MTTEELQRELADASQVIAALTSKLDRAGETVAGLEATIAILSHERDQERAEASRNWDALSDRIERLEAAGDAMLNAWLMPEDSMEYCDWVSLSADAKAMWHKAKEAKP